MTRFGPYPRSESPDEERERSDADAEARFVGPRRWPRCVWGDCPDGAEFVCEGGFGSGRTYLLCGRHATMFTTPRPGSSKEPLTKDTP